MSVKKKIVADLLFGVQLIGMFTFIIAQFVRMLHTVQGISPVWLLCAEAFCIINVSLAFRGWRQSPTRATFQLFVTHGSWTLGIGLLLTLLATKASEVVWGWYDTGTLVMVACATIIVFVVGTFRRVGITDPIVRGVLAAIFRGIPHIALAYKIGLLGGNGLAALTVWAAHATASVRIGQLGFAIREAGWDRSRRGLAIAEAASEVTWIVVTLVWLIVSR